MAKRRQLADIRPGAGAVNPFAGSKSQFKETQSEVAPKKPHGG